MTLGEHGQKKRKNALALSAPRRKKETQQNSQEIKANKKKTAKLSVNRPGKTRNAKVTLCQTGPNKENEIDFKELGERKSKVWSHGR